MKKNPSSKELTIFFQQLTTLIAANIPIHQACQLLLQTQLNETLKKIILILKNDVEAGNNIAFTLKKFPYIFNTFICNLIHIGESTGTLEKILHQVSLSLDKSLHLKNQIKQALFYPITVLAISLFVCLFMLICIVPRFMDFFHDLHAPLPWFTTVIIHLSNFIRNNYGMMIFIISGMVVLLKYLQKLLPYKQHLKNIIYHFPFVKHLMNRFYILYFVKNLSILYSSGINITDGLKLIAQISDYPKYQLMLFRLRERIMAGNQLNASLGFCAIFPPIFIQMVRIGEETGTLHTMLSTLERLYESELDRIIFKMNLLLEPLIMVILGVLIGGLVIAMYLPLFKIGISI